MRKPLNYTTSNICQIFARGTASIIAGPSDEDGLGRAFRHVHRHDTGFVNARMRVTGHLWQGRFSSVAMDDLHVSAALRYAAVNPVRARLVTRAEDWRWSSTRPHCAGRDDHVVTVAPALDRTGDFRAFLGEDFDEAFTYAALRKAETIGRPISSLTWLEDMAAKTGQLLLPAKRGPKPKGIQGFSHMSPKSPARQKSCYRDLRSNVPPNCPHAISCAKKVPPREFRF